MRFIIVMERKSMVTDNEIIQYYQQVLQKELLFDDDYAYVTFNEAFELSQNSVEYSLPVRFLEIQALSLWIAKRWKGTVQGHLTPMPKFVSLRFAGVLVPDPPVVQALLTELTELIRLLEATV